MQKKGRGVKAMKEGMKRDREEEEEEEGKMEREGRRLIGERKEEEEERKMEREGG